MSNENASWYEVKSYPLNLAPTMEIQVEGKGSKAKVRRYAKQMSLVQTDTDFVIDGYDLTETWRNGKCSKQ